LDSKSASKKKAIKITPKKGTSTAFCAGPLTSKTTAGVEQEKVGHVGLASA
jgi:hypothetical protein